MLSGKYIYDSLLPFMFAKIKEPDSPSDVMDSNQIKLWAVIQEEIIKLKETKGSGNKHEAVLQHFLERETWKRIWPDVAFPGGFPEFVDPSAFVSNTKARPILRPVPPSKFSNIMKQEANNRAALREAMLDWQGCSFEPTHGWNTSTGLPCYSIVVQGLNCQLAFTASCYRLRETFPEFRINYQRASHDLLVIWIEAKGIEGTQQLRDDPYTWETFKSLWAFFKSWGKEVAAGRTVDIFTYHGQNQEMKFPDIDTSGLLPPAPLQVDDRFGVPAANYPGRNDFM